MTVERKIKELGDTLLSSGQKSTQNLDLDELDAQLKKVGLEPIFIGFDDSKKEKSNETSSD